MLLALGSISHHFRKMSRRQIRKLRLEAGLLPTCNCRSVFQILVFLAFGNSYQDPFPATMMEPLPCMCVQLCAHVHLYVWSVFMYVHCVCMCLMHGCSVHRHLCSRVLCMCAWMSGCECMNVVYT
jgi:hypothetical protein